MLAKNSIFVRRVSGMITLASPDDSFAIAELRIDRIASFRREVKPVSSGLPIPLGDFENSSKRLLLCTPPMVFEYAKASSPMRAVENIDLSLGNSLLTNVVAASNNVSNLGSGIGTASDCGDSRFLLRLGCLFRIRAGRQGFSSSSADIDLCEPAESPEFPDSGLPSTSQGFFGLSLPGFVRRLSDRVNRLARVTTVGSFGSRSPGRTGVGSSWMRAILGIRAHRRSFYSDRLAIDAMLSRYLLVFRVLSLLKQLESTHRASGGESSTPKLGRALAAAAGRELAAARKISYCRIEPCMMAL